MVEPPRWEDVPGFSASAESFSEFLIDFVNNKPKEVDGEDGQGDRADEGALTKGDSEMKNGEVDENDNREYISSKKVRKLNRLSVAELKNLVEKPEVVDVGSCFDTVLLWVAYFSSVVRHNGCGSEATREP